MRPIFFASPLHADLAGLPPIRVHVGNDEMLLDDSVRFVEHAVAAGVDARTDVWDCMVHDFVAAVGQLQAATESLNRIGQFLPGRFAASTRNGKFKSRGVALSNQGAEGPSERSG